MKSFIALLFTAVACYAQPYYFSNPPTLPDAKLTPGQLLSNSATLEQILATGYTKTIRNVPESLKRQVFIAYFGSVPANAGQFEIDHLWSCEMSGAQTAENLWPESYLTQPWNAHVKDRLENYMRNTLRKTLASQGHDAAMAQYNLFFQEMTSNWIQAYQKYIGASPVMVQKHRQ